MSKTCAVTAGLYCGFGMVIPIAPSIAGIGAVFLVRIILWSHKQTITWNLCVITLAILATAVTLDGMAISTFFGFWIGIGYGSLGEGIIKLGNNALLNTFKERFGKALEAFMGTKSDPQ